MSKTTLFLFLITFNMPVSFHLYSATTIVGNSSTDVTFQFAVHKLVKSILSGATYSAAANNDSNGVIGNFSVARLKNGADQFMPIAPERVTLNITQHDAINPLFDQPIKELALLESGSFGNEAELPAVITHKEPNIIYLYEDIEQGSLLASLPIRDANAQIAQELIGLSADPNNYLFTFTRPADQSFGATGSGIAALVRGFVETPEGRKRLFLQLDLESGTVSFEKPGRALALDNDSGLLRITAAGSVQIGNQPKLVWDAKLNRLFVGLQVSSEASGVRPLLVGQLQGNKLLLEPFVPSSVFDGSNKLPIIGSTAPNAQANIYDLQLLHTSTGLSYLIIVANTQTEQPQVYALPIINTPNNALTGTLAAVSANPVDIPGPGPGGVTYVASRLLAVAAQTAQDLPAINDAAVLVGNGIPAGTINHLQIYRDALFAYVTAPQESGGKVYKSQPLFDASGKIKGWTDWQAAVTDAQPIMDSFIDVPTASQLIATTTNLPGDTIQRTSWLPTDLVAQINSFFTAQNGGVTFLNALITKKSDKRESSLIVAGGNDQLLVLQTGYQAHNELIPTTWLPQSITFLPEGAINQPLNTPAIMLQGGVLQEIGPLTAAAIVNNNSRQQAWLAVAGVNGLAMLQNEQGNGWAIATGIGKQFAQLPIGLQLKKVSDIKNIKKLVAVNDLLYVLTDTQLSYIESAEIGSAPIKVSLLVDLAVLGLSKYSSLTDVIVAPDYIMLGTTAGLFTARLDQAGNPVEWKQINIPQLLPSIVQLSLLSQHNRSEDIITEVGANIYIVSADAGNQQSRVTRFDVKVVNNEIVLQPFNDVKIVDQPYYFLEFGANRHLFVPDGTLFMNSAFRQTNEVSTLRVLPAFPPLQVGSALIGINNIVVNPFENSLVNLSGVVTDIATGNMIVGADDGIRINQ